MPLLSLNCYSFFPQNLLYYLCVSIPQLINKSLLTKCVSTKSVFSTAVNATCLSVYISL